VADLHLKTAHEAIWVLFLQELGHSLGLLRASLCLASTLGDEE